MRVHANALCMRMHAQASTCSHKQYADPLVVRNDATHICGPPSLRACVQVQVSGGSIGAGAGAGAGGSVGLGVANARSKVLTMTMSTFAGERVAAGDWNEQFFLARLCSMRSLSKSAL